MARSKNKAQAARGSAKLWQGMLVLALAAVLWSADASAQAIPANCPSDLGTANIIYHPYRIA